MKYRTFIKRSSGYNFKGSSYSILKENGFDEQTAKKAHKNTWNEYYKEDLYLMYYEYINKYDLMNFKIIKEIRSMSVIEFVDNGLMVCIETNHMMKISKPYFSLPDELFTM